MTDTVDEMAQLAMSRAAATGVPCAVAGFTSADHCQVFDADEDGNLTPLGTVPLDHPSPSVTDRD